MKISASVEYGARMMVHLAQLPAGAALNADTLSDAENIPRAYMDQLLLRLRRAGLVESIRGAHGGYALARPADQISIGMLMRAVDGGIFGDACRPYGPGDHQCNHASGCGIRPVWERLTNLVEGFLDKVTLSDLSESGPSRAAFLFGAGRGAATSQGRSV